MTFRTAWTEERAARLGLCWSGFGSRSLRKLREGFDSAKEAWLASVEEMTHVGIRHSSAVRFHEWQRKNEPAALIERLAQESIDILFVDDPGFPDLLQRSSDPPEILFVRGTLKDIPAVALVGTRKVTRYGRQCVEAIVPDLVRAGLATVSGLALGIDAEVHARTLDEGGTTVAVLGTGIDDASIYPRTNDALAHRILTNGGALITEFPPGTEGLKDHFPLRNRIIASLSLATIVIEASTDSGSLITAKLALEENREVLAVPGSIFSEASEGTNTLLKLGAKACTCPKDVFDALLLDRPDLVTQARAELPLDPHDQEILALLEDPQHIDELARALAVDAATISSQLTVLELKGLVAPLGGQTWGRRKR